MENRTAPSRRWTDSLARRPAATAAAVFIGGIIAHVIVPHRPIIWIILAILAGGVATVYFRNGRARYALVIALFCLGIAAAQIEAFQFAGNDIGAFASDTPRLAHVELVIDQPLRIIESSISPTRPLPPKQMTNAKVMRILTHHGWADASGRALVQIDPPNGDLAIGQRIRALGMLQRPSPAMNPGQFDWAAYYRDQRILASISIPHSDAIQIIQTASPSMLTRLQESVRAKLAAGFTEKQSLDHALLQALVLGDNDPELRDVKEQFRRTGTSHHLAISGLHIAILGMVVFAICRLFLMRPRVVAIISLVAVLFYGLVALPSPPVVRSVLLCSCIAVGIISRKSVDGIQLLALSVMGMLVYKPLDLYNAGFQLSFGTVLGLMILADRVMIRLRDRDADIAMSMARMSRPSQWLQIWRPIRAKLVMAVTVGVIAWLVSLPLIAFHFEQLNPWAVLASLALAPVVFTALIGGFAKLILTTLLPFGATTWATLAAMPVSWMRHLVDALAMIPGSDVPLPAHSISFILVYYALIFVPFLPTVRPRLKQALKLGPVAGVGLFALIPLVGGAGALPGDGSLRITVLSVGAGQCCVMELPDGRTILLDAGSATLTDPVRKCIAPFLRHRGRSSIDEIWLSHGDYDHVSAADELIRTYGVDKIVTSAEFPRHAAETATNESLLETIRQLNVKHDTLRANDRIQLGNVSVEVLWPPPGMNFSSNESGLVLKLTYARRTILFPADIQESAERGLLQSPDRLRCDVILAPHHGSMEKTTADFIDAADPLYIISSNDRTLSQRQKRFEQAIGARPLFRTNQCGAITIQIDKNGGLAVVPFAGSNAEQ